MLKLYSIFFLLLAVTASANESDTDDPVLDSNITTEHLALVKKIQGRVLYHKTGALRGEKAHEGLALFNHDMVRTKRNAEAVIHLVDGSTLFLTPSSTLRLLDNNQLAVDAGKVLFDIKKRDASRGLKIATKTAVIGVKGTRFLVSAKGADVQVFLREGKVNVEAVNAPFKEYKQQQTTEFDAFKQEFNEYSKNLKQEFSSYVSDLNMQAGQAISVTDNVLTRHDISAETRAIFERFEKEIMQPVE